MSGVQKTTHTSPANTLVERVCALDRVRAMASAISRGVRRVDTAGLAGSSAVLLIEALRILTGRAVVVCCPDEETAQDICSDLSTLSSGRASLFPEKDIFPRRFELRENLTVRGRRNACLDRVLRDQLDVVVTSLPGFLEKTVPVDALEGHARELVIGAEIDLDEYRNYLVAIGYENNPIVEEIGQFATRGAILDLFDPSWNDPVRIELFDDQIRSMRAFDIDTQRSIRRLESVRVLPATGVFVDETTLTRLEDSLKKRSVSREVIEEIRHEIEHHPFSYLLRRYAPVLGMTAAFLDFFRSPPLVFFYGEEDLERSIVGLADELEKVRRYSEDDFPLLDLYEYVNPADYYTRYDVAAVHVWQGLGASSKTGDAAGWGAATGGEPDNGRGEARRRSIGSLVPTGAIDFHAKEHPPVLGKFESLVGTLRKFSGKRMDIHIFSESSTQRERLAEMLEDAEHLVHLPVGWITSGFVWKEARLALLTDHEIFHRILPRPRDRRKTRRTEGRRQEHLQIGDFVVHVDYGIGRYVGLEKVQVGGGEAECLTLRYQGDDRIFVPLDQMPLVEKYVGKEGVAPALDRLGSSKWNRTKARTRKALEVIARDMIQMYAEREMTPGYRFPPDSSWQKELEASFPFEETPDQLRATDEIKRDMEAARPMERLVCGDVGFGKTEVAIRAAFKAVNDGKQAVVLVPTTILALQHFRTFRERLSAFPVRVEMLSRFRTAAEQREIIRGLSSGTVDVVIGTHRLLSKDVAFQDLGLVIVDEEHRFGVRSKDKLKRLRRSVDVLSMTATPIPRTLYMALSGLRPVSIIDTAPRNRHPIRTEVGPFDEETIVRAIRHEIGRDGQVFFVHNRVESIYSMQAFLERLLPEIKFGVGHGQMSEKELEKVILGFLEGAFDVLISTTIIESGLDFPNVNTIIINRADRFGLAELYQLRGRVGRREQQAFAHLLVPRNYAVTHKAAKRLQAMEEFEELGSGYRLAMRDLEIRGAGNLLGVEQHGQLVAVGFDLYCKMLKEAVEQIRGKAPEEAPACRIETSLPSFLPEDYVEDQNERMALYRRLARFEDPMQVEELVMELEDRFGPLPREAVNLTELGKLKLMAGALGIGLLRVRPDRFTAEFLPKKALRPELCAELVETFRGRLLFKSGTTFGFTLSHGYRPHGLEEAKKLLELANTHDRV